MENDAAIYPLHFGNSNFCKSMPPPWYIIYDFVKNPDI